MKYNVIASGSKGNCVVIENIMIDAGIPYKDLEEYLPDIRYLFITHIHQDHLRISTIKRIKKMYPYIQIYGNWQVKEKLGDICTGVNLNSHITNKDFEVRFFRCIHDVETYGMVFDIEGLKVIYATDTSTLAHAPGDIKFDYLFLESNHDKRKLEMALYSKGIGYNAYGNGKRHLSTQDCKTFYYTRRKDKTSELIELHKSERFY